MSDLKSRFFRGSVLRVTSLGLNTLVGLFMMPFLIHSLGDRLYGVWIIAGSVLGYYGLMDLGLNSAIQRYVSAALGEKNYDDANKTLNTIVLIFSAIGLFLAIVSFFAAFFLPVFVKNVENIVVLKLLILILGISFAVSFPFRAYSGFLMGDMRFDLISIIDIVKLLFRTAAVVFFVSKGYGVVALAIITALCNLSENFVQVLFIRLKYQYIRVSMEFLEKESVRAIFSYSVQSFLIRLTDQIKFNVHNFVIAAILGVNMVTLYSIAARLTKYLMEFMDNALGITLPLFSKYNAAGDGKSIIEKFFFLSKVASFLSIWIGLFLVIFGYQIIDFWVGEKYIEAYTILVILVIPTIFDVMQGPGVGYLYGVSKQKYYGFINFFEALASLSLSIFLGIRYGIFGIALGRAIPMLFVKIIVQPWVICRVMEIRLIDFLKESVGKTFVLSSICYVPFGLLFQIRDSTVKDFYFAASILLYVILGVGIYYFTFSGDERALLFQGLKWRN